MSDHQKYGGVAQSRTSEKDMDKAGRSSLSGYFAKARPTGLRPRVWETFEKRGTVLLGDSPSFPV